MSQILTQTNVPDSGFWVCANNSEKRCKSPIVLSGPELEIKNGEWAFQEFEIIIQYNSESFRARD